MTGTEFKTLIFKEENASSTSFEKRFAMAVDHWAEHLPKESLAIVGQTRSGESVSLTWKSLLKAVEKESERFLRSHNESNQRRILFSNCHNKIEDVVEAIVADHLNWIHAPLDKRLGEREVKRRRQQMEAGLESDSNAPLAAKTALLLGTGGTTGPPKTVALSAEAIWKNAAEKLKCVPQDPGSVRIGVLPISHAYARTCEWATWLLSGSTYIIGLGNRDLESLLKTYRPTHLNLVPSLAKKLMMNLQSESKPSDDKTSWRYGISRLVSLGCGGASLDSESWHFYSREGICITRGYGLTETAPVVASEVLSLAATMSGLGVSTNDATSNDVSKGDVTTKNATTTEGDRPLEQGCVGKVIPGWQVKTTDSGELLVKGDMAMLGYWNDVDATERRIDSDGWLSTGDIVEWTRNGALKILGRVDDVIISDSGLKWHPQWIESLCVANFGWEFAYFREGSDGFEIWYQDSKRQNAPTVRRIDRNQLLQWGVEADQDLLARAFPRDLSRSSGELTIKGTISRTIVERERFGNKPIDDA